MENFNYASKRSLLIDDDAIIKDFKASLDGGHALFACNHSNNEEDILITSNTSFPDRKNLGGEGKHFCPGLGRAHTLLSEISQPTTYQSSCVCQELGGALGLRTEQADKLWEETRGDNCNAGENSINRPTGLGHVSSATKKRAQVETTNVNEPVWQRT